MRDHRSHIESSAWRRQLAPWLAVLVAGASTGCGAAARSTEAAEVVAVTADGTSCASLPTMGAWALIRTGETQREPFVTGAASFRATCAADLERIEVRVSRGTILEHWPYEASSTAADSVAWTAARVEPRVCPGSRPTAVDAPCIDALVDTGSCESMDVLLAIPRDATCVRAQDLETPVLFYRARLARPTLPVEAVLLRGGQVAVSNTGHARIPGALIRIRRSATATHVHVRAPPAPGVRVLIGPGDSRRSEWLDASVGREALLITLLDLGSSDAEASAFLTFWDATLFGHLPADESDPFGEQSSILYFLPPSAADAVLTVSTVPAVPRHEAVAVWQILQ